jgi:tetratricopeptide (TPR) repeat protein
MQKQQFIEAKIELAEYYYQKKEYESALASYQTIAEEIHLSRPQTLFHSLVCKMEIAKKDTINLGENNDYLTSQKEMENLVTNVHDFPESSIALNYLANSFRSTGNIGKGITYTLRIPNKKDAEYLLLTQDYLQTGNLEAAKEALLYTQEKNYEQLKQLAKLQFETEDFSMAKYSFEQLILKQKSDADNYLYLGQLAFIEENFAKAVEYFEMFFTNRKSDSPLEKPATELIISLFRINNRPRAESVLKQYSKELSESAKQEIELNEGIYYKKIDAKKAEKIFSSLIKNGTEFIRMKAYFWRGVTRLEQKKTAEAKQDFEKAIFADDKQIVNESNLKLGTIYFSEENYQKSLEHYYNVIQADDKGDLALSAAQNFAVVCKTIQEWQKAIDAYEIILERLGDKSLQANTVFDIAFCYFRDKKYERAVEMFSQSIPLLQDKEMEAEAQYWIAESYAGKEQFEKAITEFLKVSYNYAAFPHWAASAELRAGETYLATRQIDRAVAIYERVITKYGRYSDWGKQAQERLIELKK